MLESKLQAECIKHAKSKGWIALKIIRSNMNGISDLILFKNGETIFVELKTKNGIVSDMQQYRANQFRLQNFKYEVINSLEKFKKLIN